MIGGCRFFLFIMGCFCFCCVVVLAGFGGGGFLFLFCFVCLFLVFCCSLAATLLVPRENDALFDYVHHATMHQFTVSLYSKPHVEDCIAVTCHLHFWQKHRDLLRATAVTDTEIRVNTKIKLTLEKKINLPGLEPAVFRSLAPALHSGVA